MNILTTDGYFNRWYEFKKAGMTHKQAYEKLEDEMFDKYGINKYSSFESFEQMLYRYIANFCFRQI